jgi:predicted RNA-binding protein (virulence factor B family)
MANTNTSGVSPENEKKSGEAGAGEFALLKAVNITRAGAFMQWREGQDLLVPVSQQISPMQKGRSYLVYLLLDPQQRMIGSTKLHRFLDEEATSLKPREKVDLIIVNETGLGYKAVINGTHLGLLYKDEVFQKLKPGDRTTGYIKAIREDRKINLALRIHEGNAQDELGKRILEYLQENQGVSTLTDYSPPEAIYKQFGVSKGKYKKALGALYKKRKISLEKDKVTLLV